MRKKKEYVVGFDEDHQEVYGEVTSRIPAWIYPLTLEQAKKRVSGLSPPTREGVIYKLVRVRI
jgi:hypothetical protein